MLFAARPGVLPMRFVLYNIRYGTGTGWRFHTPLPFTGYLRPTRENLAEITRFLHGLEPDIIGLVEVDNGSYRSEKLNQAELIARELDFSHVYESKYREGSFVNRMPVLRQQGNAFLTNQNIEAQDFHYFKHGVKRLVIELEFENYVIFLVHLSLKYRHRQYQLNQLHDLFNSVQKPMIVAGDFNAFWGGNELQLFLAASKLKNANTLGLPTFPSYAPRHQFDFILHSPEIEITKFRIPPVSFSDHMPVVCDFKVNGQVH
jgi:endonuclease/exonuclease/phosphatase family metal-dependent hydrolase